VPTPRALELAPVIARALGELDRAVAAAPFDPATCTRTFSLAIADAGQITLVPRIARALGHAMPKAQLRVIGIDSLVALGDLGSSEIDLHIGVPSRAPGLHVEPLLREALVLVGRRARPRLTKTTLATLAHVAIDMAPGRGFRDLVAAAYARAGIPRIVAVTVPSFTAAVAVVAATDLVATLPASLVASHGQRLRRLEGAAPTQAVELAMSWHERTDRDAANVAFRALVRAIAPVVPKKNRGG